MEPSYAPFLIFLPVFVVSSMVAIFIACMLLKAAWKRFKNYQV